MAGIKWVLTVTTFLVAAICVDASAYSFCQKEQGELFGPNGTIPLGDWLPWPFGSECPTPWSHLQGNWIHSNGDELGKIYIDVSDLFNGLRLVSVKRYDHAGHVVDQGSADVYDVDKIIMVSMIPADDSKPPYALFIRHYAASGSCSGGHLATVITIRHDQRSCENDVNFILKRASK